MREKFLHTKTYVDARLGCIELMLRAFTHRNICGRMNLVVLNLS